MNVRSHRLVAAAAVGILALALTACSTGEEDSAPASADDTTSGAATQDRARVGIILGGGGEVGIAWQTGVLAALQEDANLNVDTVDVVVGTSAGSFSGAMFSTGRDMDSFVTDERAGRAVGAPVGGGDANPIPPKLLAALGSTEGTIEERGQRIGALAVQAETGITSKEYVGYIAANLPDPLWPTEVDFRATSVNTTTGATKLWSEDDGVPLAAALASSSAVPGFLPTVEIEGENYTDAPRTSFSQQLVEEKDLDVIIYIGMPTPNLSNTVEEEALDGLAADGIDVVKITGSTKANEVAANALDPSLRPEAVELGVADGESAANTVRALLD